MGLEGGQRISYIGLGFSSNKRAWKEEKVGEGGGCANGWQGEQRSEKERCRDQGVHDQPTQAPPWLVRLFFSILSSSFLKTSVLS